MNTKYTHNSYLEIHTQVYKCINTYVRDWIWQKSASTQIERHTFHHHMIAAHVN